MDITGLPLFNVMRAKMQYHSARQGVLAQNIANADTPGYQAKELAAPDFKSIATGTHSTSRKNLPMALTQPGHMGGRMAGASAFIEEKRLSTYERNPNGNNVSLEEETMLVSRNQAEYQKVLGLYRKSIDLFKMALGKSGGGA